MLAQKHRRGRDELIDVLAVNLGEQVLAGREMAVKGALATPARLAIALSFSSSEFAMTARAASMIRARFSVASARRGGAVIFPVHDGLAKRTRVR